MVHRVIVGEGIMDGSVCLRLHNTPVCLQDTWVVQKGTTNKQENDEGTEVKEEECRRNPRAVMSG